MSNVRTESLLCVTRRNLEAYGRAVVEHRAVPDVRDGLKPVHRCILWALYNLGLKHTGPFKKAARTVGEVIGKYHPHGDGPAYDAMVNLTGTKDETGKTWVTKNCAMPLIEGYGNWGDNIDSAASYRYTEARLSEFSCLYLLDPVYLAVTDYVPNFSEDDKVPVVLPAKLPVLLLNGSASIAFGVSAECPGFELSGVLALVRLALQNVEITDALCAKHLKFNPTYGGECISTRAEQQAFYKNGIGTMSFVPSMTLDKTRKTITLTSACPGLTSQNSWETLTEKMDMSRLVQRVSDSTDKNGFKYEIVAARGADFEEFHKEVVSLVTRKWSYDLGVTYREKDSVEFYRTTVPDILTHWCSWRIELERKAINHLLGLEQKKLERLRLLLLAVDSLAVIMESLRVKDSTAYLVRKLKISDDAANAILELKVRQLKSLERPALVKSVAAVEREIKNLTLDLKKPELRILRDLESIKICV